MLTFLALGLWPWIAIITLTVLVIIAIEFESAPGTFMALVVGLTFVYLGLLPDRTSRPSRRY